MVSRNSWSFPLPFPNLDPDVQNADADGQMNRPTPNRDGAHIRPQAAHRPVKLDAISFCELQAEDSDTQLT